MNKHRNIHVLFSLSLFLLFVIGSFFIVTYEIKGYYIQVMTIMRGYKRVVSYLH